jgi:NAD(P)-dependent dehydrogenase (short-subunit alcohol dehydrogenase family)
MEGMAAYSVSKHGIEAYSDALRQEMVKWKVSVSVVQPAGFLTG